MGPLVVDITKKTRLSRLEKTTEVSSSFLYMCITYDNLYDILYLNVLLTDLRDKDAFYGNVKE